MVVVCAGGVLHPENRRAAVKSEADSAAEWLTDFLTVDIMKIPGCNVAGQKRFPFIETRSGGSGRD